MSGMDNRQQRKIQRRRIRTYMASVNSLSHDAFVRQTRHDLKSAVMRSCIPDAVMVARTIFKKERSAEWSNDSTPAWHHSNRTEGQKFIQIFLSAAGDDTETPLLIAANAGATRMVHFILSLQILFEFDEKSISRHDEAHTIMAWMHKQDCSRERLWKEELIMTVQGSHFCYLYEQQFTIKSLVDFALPHLSPHTKLEKCVASVGEQVASKAPKRDLAVSSIAEEEKDHRCSEDTSANVVRATSPAENCSETSAILVNISGGENSINFDGDDCSDAGFSFVRNDSINEENEWEVVSNVSSILSF